MNDVLAKELVLPLGLDPAVWSGSFNGIECSLHQLAPYVGKLKTGMVRAILSEYTVPTDLVFDPFSGSGVVPLEAILMGRRALANDLSDYAYALTIGKLSAPMDLALALEQAENVICEVIRTRDEFAKIEVPDWVASFFHPDTLAETLAAFAACERLNLPFVRACLLGILHHVRPGFLSYPASHLTPYLRHQKYPRDQHSEMYNYRDVASRLRAKVQRSYRRTSGKRWKNSDWAVNKHNSMQLDVSGMSVDCIISSPPYFGALDYARDNRLRLWFLGVTDWKGLDKSLTASDQTYLPQMRSCLREMLRVLKPGKHCILVLGDVTRNGKTRYTAEIIAQEAVEMSNGEFVLETIVADEIPDERRSRRKTSTTKVEKLVVLRKLNALPRASRPEYTANSAPTSLAYAD